MVQVLKQCGDNLTRENVMKQAANLKNFHSDLMLPGIMVNTAPDDYFPIEQMQLMRFNGESWECSARSSRARSGTGQEEGGLLNGAPSLIVAIPEFPAPPARQAG